MREIAYGKQFEKSLKLAKKRKKDLIKLFKLAELLKKDEAIPARHRNHKLVGNYEGYWELYRTYLGFVNFYRHLLSLKTAFTLAS